jgi:excisionase family DNA binding protein
MEKLVDIKEVCQVLGVKEHWLYRETKKQKIPHYRVGGHLRFSMAEIRDYLERNRQQVTQEGEGNANH